MSSDLVVPKLRTELASSQEFMQSDRRIRGRKNKEELRPLPKITIDL